MSKGGNGSTAPFILKVGTITRCVDRFTVRSHDSRVKKKPCSTQRRRGGWDPNWVLYALNKGIHFNIFWELDHTFRRPARNPVSVYDAFCTPSITKKDVTNFHQMWYNCLAETPCPPFSYFFFISYSYSS
jgi:hypothetical protein